MAILPLRKEKEVSGMVCGCRQCGTLMVQEQKGLASRCICPACGEACDACLGTNSQLEKGESLPLDIIMEYDDLNIY